MLRRDPTAITLTTEDVSAYENRREEEQKMAEAEYHAQMQAENGSPQQQQKTQNMHDPNNGSRSHPGAHTQQVKTKAERLGLDQGNGTGSRG
ncbi:uncharacterized protein L3040_007623 [Drepanopeziza brunnea f. sp. 'multigermtubi']|uniref:Anaphase-promoting complex, subunit CDC26 n=1 Tax=Marssonina brunnea f. sp. multigermtubi (strain MB_m1) TaxID=1072389 RepID=K1WZ16_MARBU|nr:uncharacterized protein MBM_03978 [Drepanopeziza brunnea f. sp. 'multigermtubi' MB_m1]EKD18206.1 hypothetical protein MBM_03978 [Drepanopeziza brunnea f. sp. 'multigermtubi' MB_m1]KAJ5037448.1 hypothetical protein L3040_007623 [Drepanopeziza brunnea f. sp. 'multigermtubi']